MFIRRVKKQRNSQSKIFYQYTLAQSTRIGGKVKQRALLYLGSETLMADPHNRKLVLQLLKAKIYQQPLLIQEEIPNNIVELAEHYYHKYLIKYGEHPELGASHPPVPEKADYHTVDVKTLEVEDARTFGAEHLCKQVMEKLELDNHLKSLGWNPQKRIKALISIIARALFCASEYKTARLLEYNSELKSCYHYKDTITHKQLYSIADDLFANRASIDTYLYNKVCSMFDLKDKLVIFDISNTYFETSKRGSEIAAFGRSKEKRNDCPIVVFAGVINKEGFIQHSKIYKGNTSDSATLADMLDDLETHSNKGTKKTIVIDAGIASEENLELIHSKNYKYVCVARKRLKEYALSDTTEKRITQLTDRGKNKVELSIFTPSGFNDTWMYVQSEAKRKKEESIQDKLCDRFEEELENINSGIHKKGGTKKLEKVWERIGRAKQKNTKVSSRYQIKVSSKLENKHQYATSLTWVKKPSPVQDEKTKGVYFIRTNYKDSTEEELWEIYNTIREVESTFRCLKTDLNIRPIHHQKDERIQSHIYLTTLAYQLINTIRHMLKQNGINHSWTEVVSIMNTQKIQTVVLPTETKNIHLRLPSKPILKAKKIYDATQCTETQKALKKYVVYH